MSYQSIAEMTQSSGLRNRLTACAAQEFKNAGQPTKEPGNWVNDNIWIICAAAGWGAQWESGQAAYPGLADVGEREDVITDGDILASIQPMVLAEVLPQGEPQT
jgi:hypothetical protein